MKTERVFHVTQLLRSAATYRLNHSADLDSVLTVRPY